MNAELETKLARLHNRHTRYEVIVDFAYPSSPHARRFGYERHGCYIVKQYDIAKLDKILSVHSTLLGARNAALATGLPLHPFMNTGWRAGMSELHVGEFHGSTRENGSVIGFDYASQCWFDTDPETVRDDSRSLGSAANPIQLLPAAVLEAFATATNA